MEGPGQFVFRKLWQFKYGGHHPTGLAEALAACRCRLGENTRAASAGLDENTAQVRKIMPSPSRSLMTRKPVTHAYKVH